MRWKNPVDFRVWKRISVSFHSELDKLERNGKNLKKNRKNGKMEEKWGTFLEKKEIIEIVEEKSDFFFKEDSSIYSVIGTSRYMPYT